jgi:hypothetical protein
MESSILWLQYSTLTGSFPVTREDLVHMRRQLSSQDKGMISATRYKKSPALDLPSWNATCGNIGLASYSLHRIFRFHNLYRYQILRPSDEDVTDVGH